jgi:hypothetical protein
MKKVGLVQSKIFFTKELKDEYLGNIPLLTSTKVEEIYKFIKKNAKKHNIYKYVLHINSRVLSEFIDFIHDKRKESSCACELFSKCIFIATYSNADNVRDKNIIKKTNIYFGLSPLSTIIKFLIGTSPEKIMLVVSDSDTPYYNQAYSYNITPKYRISELTSQDIDYFVLSGGINITLALDTREEYEKLFLLVQNSRFRNQLVIIEADYLDLITQHENLFLGITTGSSGVCVLADSKYYEDLNQNLLYEDCVAVLINQYCLWEHFIKNHVVTIGSPNYNTTISKIK